jgi:hypothetical protein
MPETVTAPATPATAADPISAQPPAQPVPAGAQPTPPATPPAAPPAQPAAPTPGAPAAEAQPETFELAAPEGVTFDAKELEKFGSFAAKDLKLSKEQAQKLVQYQADAVKAQDAQVAQFREDQLKETRAMLGADADAKLAKSADAIKRLAGESVLNILKAAGVDNQKEVVAWFLKLGDKVSEDLFVEGAPAPGGAEKTLAERMYPHLKPQ